MVTYILIPAHNEESIIGHVIDGLKAYGWNNILVVNDASTDNTAKVAKYHGARVIESLLHRGQGSALRAGFEYFCSHAKPDIVITFDADGQHRASDISALIEPIVQKRADIVLGSRFLRENSSSVPFVRMLVLKCAVLFTRIMTGLNITDTHCGIRALNYTAYSSIQFSHPGMAHASELFDIIKKKNLKWQEVSVTVDYTRHSLDKGQKIYHALPIACRYIFNKIKHNE